MKDLKRLEKKHGELRKRRMEDLTPFERIWNYYFNMDFDIVLSPGEETTRKIYEHAYEAVQKYYPSYTINRIASFVCRSLSVNMKIERSHRQCITYVNESINLFGEPVDIEKEKRKQLYIARLSQISSKAEKSKNYDASYRALAKAAELENFNEDTDDKIREMMKNQEAKEIVFAASMDDLKTLVEQRKKARENIEEAELVDDDD